MNEGINIWIPKGVWCPGGAGKCNGTRMGGICNTNDKVPTFHTRPFVPEYDETCRR